VAGNSCPRTRPRPQPAGRPTGQSNLSRRSARASPKKPSPAHSYPASPCSDEPTTPKSNDCKSWQESDQHTQNKTPAHAGGHYPTAGDLHYQPVSRPLHTTGTAVSPGYAVGYSARATPRATGCLVSPHNMGQRMDGCARPNSGGLVPTINPSRAHRTPPGPQSRLAMRSATRREPHRGPQAASSLHTVLQPGLARLPDQRHRCITSWL
jgi:hypothetical protein